MQIYLLVYLPFGASLNRQVAPLWLDKQRLFGMQRPTLRERKLLTTYIKLLSTISQVGRVKRILIDLQSSVEKSLNRTRTKVN